jgi:transmembrane sensor
MKGPDDEVSAESDRVEEAAMAWLLERDEGFSPDRAAEFERWRHSHPLHAAAVQRLEQTWHLLEGLALPSMKPAEEATVVPFPRAKRRVVLGPMLAAAAALVLVFAWWRVSERNLHAHYAAEAGAVQRITLPDGSVVALNGGSMAEVRYSGGDRRVMLRLGEAHFQVAHDPARPFLVVADGITVRAVGTAFNVRVGAAAVEVVVASGKVRLITPNPGQSFPPTEQVATPLLERGDRVVVPRSEFEAAPAITRLDPEQLREALAWQQEMLTFNDTPLREVVDQFNRRSRIQLRISDADLGARLVGGKFAADNVEAFVTLLERGGDLTAERRGEREIILRRSR